MNGNTPVLLIVAVLGTCSKKSYADTESKVESGKEESQILGYISDS